MIEIIEKAIKALAEKTIASDANDAMKFSQAALNLMNCRASFFVVLTPEQRKEGSRMK